MNKRQIFLFLLFLILVIFPFYYCYANSFYLSFLFYSIYSQGLSFMMPEYEFYLNSLLKYPLSVYLTNPWLIGYEIKFSDNSIFNHIFEFELYSSYPFIYGDYGKIDTVWLFYLKYGIGLKKISIENLIFFKFSLFAGICYGYHYITYKPLVPEDEQYYLKTFHYFDFYIEPKIAYGFMITENLFIFLSYSRKISIFYTKGFNPLDFFQFALYFEYII